MAHALSLSCAVTRIYTHRGCVQGLPEQDRHESDFGVYGVWGGMVEGERSLLRRRWLGGTRVMEFLQGAPLT
jgi:hypothetical protein